MDPAVVSFCEKNGVSKAQIKEGGNWKAGEEMLSNSESHVEKACLHHGKDLLTSCLTFFYGIVVDERTPWHLFELLREAIGASLPSLPNKRYFEKSFFFFAGGGKTTLTYEGFPFLPQWKHSKYLKGSLCLDNIPKYVEKYQNE